VAQAGDSRRAWFEIRNQQVVGSNPMGGSKKSSRYKALRVHIGGHSVALIAIVRVCQETRIREGQLECCSEMKKPGEIFDGVQSALSCDSSASLGTVFLVEDLRGQKLKAPPAPGETGLSVGLVRQSRLGVPVSSRCGEASRSVCSSSEPH